MTVPDRIVKVRRYTATEEWRVDWERAGTLRKSPNTRILQTYGGMERFLRKLLSDGRPDLAPIVYLEIRKRKVGPWRSHGRHIVDEWTAKYFQGQRLTDNGWQGSQWEQ